MANPWHPDILGFKPLAPENPDFVRTYIESLDDLPSVSFEINWRYRRPTWRDRLLADWERINDIVVRMISGQR